jgi:hypothetical protein
MNLRVKVKYSGKAVNLAVLNVNWFFLDRGRFRALIAADRADCDVQLAQYQRSVLLVLEDVENALVSYARPQDRDVQLQLAANYSKLAADFAGVVLRMELPAYWTCWTRAARGRRTGSSFRSGAWQSITPSICRSACASGR